MAAAKRQSEVVAPKPTPKRKVGRPKSAKRASDDQVADAVAAIEAEAAAPATDETPSIFDDVPDTPQPAAVPDTPLMQRLDTQVIAHSGPPSHVSCIRNSLECVLCHPAVLFDSKRGGLSNDMHRLLRVYRECIQLR